MQFDYTKTLYFIETLFCFVSSIVSSHSHLFHSWYRPSHNPSNRHHSSIEQTVQTLRRGRTSAYLKLCVGCAGNPSERRLTLAQIATAALYIAGNEFVLYITILFSPVVQGKTHITAVIHLLWMHIISLSVVFYFPIKFFLYDKKFVYLLNSSKQDEEILKKKKLDNSYLTISFFSNKDATKS